MSDIYDLRFYVEGLNDIEHSRIGAENRLRVLTRTEPDEDGIMRGFGLSEDDKRVVGYAKMVEDLVAIEAAAIKQCQKAIKSGPFAEFVKVSKGVGEKQLARLLACTGDPYWHIVEDRPRTVSELWSYCGYSVVEGRAPHRAKGKKANWNPDARMRARLIAESCVKAKGGHYRAVYDDARTHYAEAKHKYDCAQCSAKPGEPLKDGHKHARALRKVSKEILKDLWICSKEQHDALNKAS